MGLGSNNGGGGNTKYLSIRGGAIWDVKNLDKEDPNYCEEDWEAADNTGTRKGCKYNSLSGMFESCHFKDSDWGEELKVYLEDDGQLYCLSFSIKDQWTAYLLAKKMMVGLMCFDKNKPLTINVTSEKQGDFTNVNIWFGQDGKSVVVNPDQLDEHFKADKHIPMSDSVKELLSTVPTTTVEQRKVMKKKQIARSREDELEALRGIIEEFYLDTLNEKSEGSKDEKPAAKKETVKETVAEEVEEPIATEEATEEVADEKPMTAREKKLAELKAKMKK